MFFIQGETYWTTITDQSAEEYMQHDYGEDTEDTAKFELDDADTTNLRTTQITKGAATHILDVQPQIDPSKSQPQSMTSPHIAKNRKRSMTEPPARWKHGAVTALLEAYKENIPSFENQSLKKVDVWNKVKEKLEQAKYSYTTTQIITKFKYLKKHYLEKKDNMGPKGTGQAPIDFDYYDEFEEMFSEKPNVYPVSVASSDQPYSLSHSQQKINVTDSSHEQDKEQQLVEVSGEEPEEEMIQPGPSKRPPKREHTNQLLKVVKDIQQDKNRRYEDMMRRMEAMNERSCKTFEDVMQKFIDKM